MSDASRLALLVIAGAGVVWLLGAGWSSTLRWIDTQGRVLKLRPGTRRFWTYATYVLGPLSRLLFIMVHPMDETRGSGGSAPRRGSSDSTRAANVSVTGFAGDPDDVTHAPVSDLALRVVEARRVPELVGRRFPLVDGINAVGRQPTAEPGVELIALPQDSAVSRDQFYIETMPDGTLAVVDRFSRYGTRVNGHRISPETPTPVKPGDRIQAGNTILMLVQADGEAADGPMTLAPDALEDLNIRVRINSAPRFRLRVVRGPDAGKSVTIGQRRLTIGRSHDCDWRLSGTKVSRRHAEVWQEGDIVRIKDLGSSYGLFVNRHKHQNRALEPDDVIQLGENELRFEAL